MGSDDTGDGSDPIRRWIAEQIQRSVRDFEQLDVEALARITGWDPERAREQLENAGEWLSTHAENLSSEALRRLEDVVDPNTLKRVSSFIDPELLRRFTSTFASATGGGRASGAPHPLDQPTPAQGLALSAIDSGRWTVAPGSHEPVTEDGSPVPEHASSLIGELRARDWIDASGQLTQVGRNALSRWMNEPPATASRG